MQTRLFTVAPEMYQTLDSCDGARRRDMAHAVAGRLLELYPESKFALHEALVSRNIENASKIAERLDERYLDLNDEGAAEVEDAFTVARVAMAVRFAINGDLEETLYEAMMAVDDVSTIDGMLKELLKNAPT